MADMKWKDAIVKVMREAGQAIHYTAIAEAIAEKGLRTALGATPAQSVSAFITTSINNEGEASPFRRTQQGEYILHDLLMTTSDPIENRTVVAESPAKTIVQCVGMFWHRDKVNWRSKPKLLGKEQRGASDIDFCEQRGTYLLHDRGTVIYVGRTTDRDLGRRLFEHTQGRLDGRWDRFSWFGLRGVREDASLFDLEIPFEQDGIIALIEAVLIEALEPPQNRRSGDYLRASEFIQVTDSEIMKKAQKELLAQMARNIDP